MVLTALTLALSLAPGSDLAKALDAVLPVAGPQEFYSVQKRAVFDGENGPLLVTCTTETMPSRTPQPLKHFLGCEAQPAEGADAGLPHWTVQELLTKAAQTTQPSTPPCNPHSRVGCDG